MLYTRMILVMGASLYTSRLVLAALGVVDFGIFNVVAGIVVIFSFINSAMAQSAQRFLAFDIPRSDPKRLRNTFRTAFTIHLIIAAVALLIAETAGLWLLNSIMNIPASQMDAANRIYQCTVFAFVISIVQVPYSAAIIAHEKMHIYAYIGILEAILKLAIAMIISVAPEQQRLFDYALMLTGISVIICAIHIIYARTNFKECSGGWHIEKGAFSTMLSYGAWSAMGTLAWACKSQGCNIILNIFFGPAINAAYAISNQVNAAINSFVINFTTAINPQIIKTYSRNEFEPMQRLIVYGAKFSFLLMLLLSFPVIINANRLLHLWLTDVPPYTCTFSQLILLNALIETITYSIGAGVHATGKIRRYQIIVGTTILLNLPLSYLLLKAGCEPTIVFLITIAITIVTIAQRIRLIKLVIPAFDIPGFIRKVILPAFYTLIATGIIFIADTHFRLLESANLILSLAVSLLIALTVALTIGMNSPERRHLLSYIRNIGSDKKS